MSVRMRACVALHAVLQLGHEDVELQARAAYALAMHATDDPVRLKVQQARQHACAASVCKRSLCHSWAVCLL
jgi:hypothetical protein